MWSRKKERKASLCGPDLLLFLFESRKAQRKCAKRYFDKLFQRERERERENASAVAVAVAIEVAVIVAVATVAVAAAATALLVNNF